MPMFPPLFCTGFGSSVALVALVGGARTASLSSASPVGVGQHLFVSAADGSECEYLGKVTAAEGSSVTFQFPAYSGKTTGATSYIVFGAESVYQATSTGGTWSMTTSREAGIESLSTTGPELIHTQMRDRRDFVELVIGDARASDFQAYKDWLEDEADGGLKRFMVAYNDAEVGRVRLDQVKLREPGAALTAAENAYILRRWPVALQVVQRDYFGGVV